MPILVNVENFARAESDLMFSRLAAGAGGTNVWQHYTVPTPLDNQPIVRLNRDTLYSVAIVDVTSPVTLRLPDAGERYMSAMIVNQDHFIPEIFHGRGEYVLTRETCGTDFVLIGVRTLVDPSDPADVAVVNALQDALEIDAPAVQTYELPDYDQESQDAVRTALLRLNDGLSGYTRAFGRADEVDPVRHLIGSAAGWGGLPEHEANYVSVFPGVSPGDYTMRMADVPVDAFWSVSVYDSEGFFDPAAEGHCNLNSVTAVKEDDGAVVIRFGVEPDGSPNFLTVKDGWNLLIRQYQPRAEALDGTWEVPAVEALRATR